LIEDFGDALKELSPMGVSFVPCETSEVVPVSFESKVTETGVLQLWCVARDGLRENWAEPVIAFLPKWS
jgi:hypothetical protein